MARLKRNEEGEWVTIYGEGEDRESVDAILAQARQDPTVLAALEGPGSFRVVGSGGGGQPQVIRSGESGGPVWSQGSWGTRGYGAKTGEIDGSVMKNGQRYYRIGGMGGDQLQGKLYQGRPFTDYLVEDPEWGTLMRADALAEAGKYNPRDIGDYLPSIMMAAANFIPGLQGAPSLFTSLGQGLGLTSGALPVGMTGAEIAGIGQGAGSLASDMGLVDFLNNPAGATSGNAALESAVSGWEQTIPGTMTEGVLPGAVGDPFIDAYTPVGTGGGPTGLALPGAVGDPFIDAYTPIGTGGDPSFPEWDPEVDFAESASGEYGTPTTVAPGVSAATGGLWPATGTTPSPGLLSSLAKALGLTEGAASRLLASVGSGALGLYNADRNRELAREVIGLGAPARARFESMSTPQGGKDWISGNFMPVADQMADVLGRKWSVAAGNPAGSPTARISSEQDLATAGWNALTGEKTLQSNVGFGLSQPIRGIEGLMGANTAQTGALGGSIAGILSAIGGGGEGDDLASLEKIIARYPNLFTRGGGGSTVPLP